MIQKKIYLDFYNHNINSLRVKQNDSGRTVEVVCTYSGKKYFLDSDVVRAYILFNKKDSTFSFKEGRITEDGTVLIEFTSPMTSVVGKQSMEILIVKSEGLNVENLSGVACYEDFGANVISTMPLYVTVIGSVVDSSEITSLSEFDALTNALSRLVATEIYFKELDSSLKENENDRQEIIDGYELAELNRVNAEKDRIDAEIKRQDDITGESYRQRMEEERNHAENERQNGKQGESYRISNEEKRNDAENLRKQNEEGRQYAEILREETFNERINHYNTTFDGKIIEYNDAVDESVDKIDKALDQVDDAIANIKAADELGAISNSDKGTANGVATLNENAVVPSEQLPFITELENATTYGKIIDAQALAAIINNLHMVYYGSDDPNNSLGKDGDIYMKIIVDDTEEGEIIDPEIQGGE